MRPVGAVRRLLVSEQERAQKRHAFHDATDKSAAPPAGPAVCTRLERLEIGDGRAQAGDVVLEMAEAEIAQPAQQPAYQFGRVMMIDAQPLDRPLLTDCAHAVLLFEQRVVLLGRDPVVIFQPGPAVGSRIVFTLLAVRVGMLRPFAPALGVDGILVVGIEGPIVGKRAQAEVGIFRIAFFLALALGRHGTAFEGASSGIVARRTATARRADRRVDVVRARLPGRAAGEISARCCQVTCSSWPGLSRPSTSSIC
jgi:hypothetical protein